MSKNSFQLSYKSLWMGLSLFFLCPIYSFSATKTVTNSNDAGSGSLRDAINTAASGDIIELSQRAGTTITLTTGVLSVKNKSITIQNSSSSASPVVISGNNSRPVFYVNSSGSMTLKKVTLSKGLAKGGFGGGGGGGAGGGGGFGGALFVDNGGVAALEAVTLSENKAQGGVGGTYGVSNPCYGGGGGAGGSDGPRGTTISDSYQDGAGGGGGGWGEGNGGGAAACTASGGSGISGNGGGCNSSNCNGGAPSSSGGGGGGGGCKTANGGGGGFGGGGGGGGSGAGNPNSSATGGYGGFGGGGGGTSFGNGQVGGYGGGAGDSGGGGGAGFGGAIFVRQGGFLTLNDAIVFSGNSVVAGGGGSGGGAAGTTAGPDVFLNSGATLTFRPAANMTFSSVIAADNITSSGGVILDATSSDVTLILTAANTYMGGTTLKKGTLQVSSIDNMGRNGQPIVLSGGTLFAQGDISPSGAVSVTNSSTISTASGKTTKFTGTLTGSNGETLSLIGPGTNSLLGVAVNDADSFIITGVIGGSQLLNKIGTGTLTLVDNNTYTGGTTVSGGTLKVSSISNIGGSGKVINLSGGTLYTTGDLTTSGALNVTANSTLSTEAGKTSTFTGTLTGSKDKTLTLSGSGINSFSTVTVNNADTFTISGSIGGSQLLRKTGTGVLSLTGSNTYTGGTSVIAGTLKVNSDASIGGVSLSLEGGTLTCDNGTSSMTFSKDINVTSTSYITTASGKTSIFTGTLTGFNGKTVTLSGANSLNIVAVNNADSFTLAGIISGVQLLQKTGTGTLVLTGASTYTAGIAITNGTVSINSDTILPNGNITLGSSSTSGSLLTSANIIMSQSKVITIEAAGGIFKPNSGTTLTLDNSVNGISGPGTLILNGSGTLLLQGTGTNTYLGGTTISSGVLKVMSSGALPSSGNMINDAALQFGSSSSVSYAGDISGRGSLTQLGTGVLTLSGNNTYSGVTTISSGTIQISSIDNIGGSGRSITLSGGTLLASGDVTTSGSLSVTNSSTISVDAGKMAIFTGNVTGSKDKILTLSGSGTTSFATITVNSSDVFTINGSIGGAQKLDKEGTGTLVLTGNNTYSGGTQFSSGTIKISSIANIGGSGQPLSFSGGMLTVLGDITTSGSVDIFYSATITVDADKTATFTGPLTGFGGRTLTLSGSGVTSLGTIAVDETDTFTISGIIGGAQLLQKIGTGTLSLVSSNTYMGGTLIAEGAISTSADAKIPKGNITLGSPTTAGFLLTTASFSLSQNKVITIDAGGGGFKPNSGTTLTVDNTLNGITGSGILILNGAGTVVLQGTGTNTYLGGTTISQGILKIVTPGAIPTSGNVINNGVLQFASSSDITYAKDISGTGSFTQLGSGVVTLSGNNTYSGGTTISAGTLKISSISNIGGSGRAINLSGGTLLVAGNITTSGALNITNNSTIATDLEKVATFTGTLTGSNGKTVTLSGSGVNAFSKVKVNGTDSFTIAGVMGGSQNLVKSGDGTLILTGVNTYTGQTVIQAGAISIASAGQLGGGGIISLQTSGILRATGSSTLSNPVSLVVGNSGGIDVVGSGVTLSLEGAIEGDGDLNKLGSGILVLSQETTYTGVTNVTAGIVEMKENAVMYPESSIGFVTVSSGATLNGNTPTAGAVPIVNGNVDVYGTLSGSLEVNGAVTSFSGATVQIGNSPGTISVESVSLGSGSTVTVFVGPQGASLLNIAGGLVIAPDISLVIDVDLVDSFIPIGIPEEIIAYAGVSGTFANVRFNTPFITGIVNYDVNDATVTLSYVNPGDLNLTGNALSVAEAIYKTAVLEKGKVPLPLALLLSMNPDEVSSAFNQMQPSLFKGLTIAQENSAIKVVDSIEYRIQSALDSRYCCSAKEAEPFHVWIDGIGEAFSQHSVQYAKSPQVAYQENMGGGVVGADYHFKEYFYVGALGAYTASDVKWSENQGKGRVKSGYAGLYFSVLSQYAYTNISFIESWSHFTENRNLIFPLQTVSASSSHGGEQSCSHLDAGFTFGWNCFKIRPFDSLDYLVQREGGFREKGAAKLNLAVRKSRSTFLRNELGLNFSGCFSIRSSSWTIAPKISWVREIRATGSHYTAEFLGTNVPFTVTGYFPNRSLLSPGIRLTGNCMGDLITMSLYYDGEFTKGYRDHFYGGEVRFGF